MKTSVRKHTSVWQDTITKTDYPSYSKSKKLKVDVAIIGGGLAGLNAAYQLKKKGKTVAVLEADKVGAGVSGHTTAHITSEHNLIYKFLIETIGKDKAQLYADANQQAIITLQEIIEQEKIACDFKVKNQFLVAEKQDQLKTLQEEFKAAQELGLPVTFNDGLDLPFPTAGSIRYSQQAQFHPGKYLQALAKIVHGDGSFIFENTRVLNVTEGDPCVVQTVFGDLEATDVIVATNFPILDRGGFFARMMPMRSYVIGVYITEKLDAMYDDVYEPFHYIRTQQTAQGTLVLIGGEDHITGQKEDTRECFKKLEGYAREHFTVKSIAYYWSSQDTYPYDRVPFIGKYTPFSNHLFVSTGYYGYGMTNSVVSALLLTDLILGKKNKWEELYSPLRLNVTSELPELIKGGYFVSKNQVETHLSKYIPSKELPSLSSLKPGEAKVLTGNNKKVAAYKDSLGNVHAVSAVCSHLGCGVSFNTVEESWDCPCHGSRFDSDGEILHGPAVRPLEKISSK